MPDDELVVHIYGLTSVDSPSLPDGVVELRLEDDTVLDYTTFSAPRLPRSTQGGQ